MDGRCWPAGSRGRNARSYWSSSSRSERSELPGVDPQHSRPRAEQGLSESANIQIRLLARRADGYHSPDALLPWPPYKLELFREYPQHPSLRNRPLGGAAGYRCVDATDDWRALFSTTRAHAGSRSRSNFSARTSSFMAKLERRLHDATPTMVVCISVTIPLVPVREMDRLVGRPPRNELLNAATR